MTASFGQSAYNQSPGLQTVSPGAMDLYVAADAAGASDSNPGTIALPLSTINEAVRRVNKYDVLTGLTTIHIAPAATAYTLTTLPQPKTLRIGCSWVFNGDGAGQGGDGFTVLKAPAAAQAGSSAVQLVALAGLGVNTFRGKTLEITSGAANGDRRTIDSHTDTTIIPARNFSAAVANGDTYRILEPAVKVVPTLSALGNTTFCDSIAGGAVSVQFTGDPVDLTASLAFVNIGFQPAVSAGWSLHRSRVNFYGCEYFGTSASLPAVFHFDGSELTFGTEWSGQNCRAFLGLSYGAVSNTSWSGWGLYAFRGCSLFGTSAHGFIVAGGDGTAAPLQVRTDYFHLVGGSISVTGGTAGAFGINAGSQSRLVVGFISVDVSPAVQITNTGAGQAAIDIAALNATQQVGTMLFLNKATLSSSGGTLLRARGGVIIQVGTSANVSGTAGSGFGIDMRAGARAELNGVTGLLGSAAGADLTVDAGATSIAVATLAAADAAAINALTGSCIVRVL